MTHAGITTTTGSPELTAVLGDLCVAELWKLIGTEDEVQGCVVAWLAGPISALLNGAWRPADDPLVPGRWTGATSQAARVPLQAASEQPAAAKT